MADALNHCTMQDATAGACCCLFFLVSEDRRQVMTTRRIFMLFGLWPSRCTPESINQSSPSYHLTSVFLVCLEIWYRVPFMRPCSISVERFSALTTWPKYFSLRRWPVHTNDKWCPAEERFERWQKMVRPRLLSVPKPPRT